MEGEEKNCVLCRHFVSGPPWMKQLWLHGTALLERFTQTNDRIEDLDRRRAGVLARRNAAPSEGERASLQREEAALGVQRDALVSVHEITLKSVCATYRLLEMSEAIRRRNEGAGVGEGVDLIVQDPASTVEFMETSDFERSAVITAASRVYPMMHDAQAEARRNAFLDRVVWENGGRPLTVAPLSEDQKRFAQDSLARLLMERIGRVETQSLVEGRLRLQDVGLVGDVERIVGQELGRPLPILAIDHSKRELIAAGR